MSDIINKYPYTDLHSVNLDYILKIVRENAGLHLEVSGNQLLMKTADNTIISAITIPYATSANTANTASSASYASTAGSAASAAYATEAATAATATTATSASHATSADTATSATNATNATNATYATTAGSATNATNAINAQTAAYAETTGSVTHAQKAIESVTINGDKIRFTAYDGSNIDITAPYAVKAQKDDLGNIIKSTYVANVVDDNGVMKFNDAQGNTIVSLTPSASMASVDNYGNDIADYVKAILVSSNSNYVTVDHGDGTSDSITIHYSETAWKDSNGNVIKNSYVKRIAMVTDPNDGHKKLVAYNGDTPEAEIFRLELEAYSAQIAQEANHAARADFASTAAEATTATTAATATSCPATAYFIKCYTNHDGSYSSDDPDTLTLEGIYDAAGNTVSISDITYNMVTNMYVKFHQAENDPNLIIYPVGMVQQSTPTSPIFFYVDRVTVAYEPGSQKEELTSFHLSVAFMGGSLVDSAVYATSNELLPPIT